MNKIVLSLVFLILGCGRVLEVPAPAEEPVLSQTVLTAEGQKYCGVVWKSRPAKSGQNAVQVFFDASTRGADFRGQNGTVFAQMKCCNSIRAGTATWVTDDQLSVSNLELWPGEWLLVVQTEVAGVITQRTVDLVVR